MFESIMKFFKKVNKGEKTSSGNSKDAAKERLHLVLMQDRANVSADFLELMKQEIIEVIKKYIDIDESAIDVRLTNKENEDGTNGAPALYANIPIMNIKNEARKIESKQEDIVKKEINSEKEENAVKKEINSEKEEDAVKKEINSEKEEDAVKKETNSEKKDAVKKEEDESKNKEEKDLKETEVAKNIKDEEDKEEQEKDKKEDKDLDIE